MDFFLKKYLLQDFIKITLSQAVKAIKFYYTTWRHAAERFVPDHKQKKKVI